MSQQGKALSIGQKLSIVNLKKSFDAERKMGPTVPTKDPVGRVSRSLNVGIRTVENILSGYNKNDQTLVELPQKSRGKPPLKVSGDLVSHIRHRIRYVNMQGEHISVRNLHAWLIQEFSTDIPLMTLWRSLRRIGFIYGRNKRRSTLKEQDYVISARRKYLREKISNRNDDGTLKRPEVYLDETYLNKNHSNENTWFLNDDGPWVNKPSGKGPRLIIVHAITLEGWVDGAELVFQAKNSTGDYHGQMNFDNFSKWFCKQLLPNIPNNSIIIMDNAKYHNILTDDTFPTPRSSKRELQAWLEKNHSNLKHHDDPSMLKAELYEICKKIAPHPEFKLDRIAAQHGHRILRTPQYHCELQPIEPCWGIVKNFCCYHCDFTMKGLNKQLHKGFSKVSKTTCQKLIGKVRQQEDLFWKEDAEVDDREMIEQGINFSVENYINAEEDNDFE